METVLGWLFDNILGPLLESVLWPIIESTLDLIFEIFAKIFYSILVSLLQIVDAMQNAFNIFAGIQSVTYGSYELPLIEMLFRVDTIQWAVLIITILGFCLTFVFAVLATARSMMELDSDNPRPVSKVLRATFQAMLRFALIPHLLPFPDYHVRAGSGGSQHGSGRRRVHVFADDFCGSLPGRLQKCGIQYQRDR